MLDVDERILQEIEDPVHFSETFLSRELWKTQRDIARSIESSPLTAVKGCHASGKTFLAAGLPLWWLVKHPRGKVFTTAPTFRQVLTFWKEITLARDGGLVKEILPVPTKTALEINEGRYAFGASSSAGVNIQGLHGTDVLIIADEAPGIEADIWDAIEGIRAGGSVRVLELGNPVIPSGHFYDCFSRGRGIYNCMSIGAFDTPNLQREDGSGALTLEELDELPEERMDWAPYPFLITRRWVRERYRVWGPKHPKFRSRVMAEFPSQSPYSVFNLEWIEGAKRDTTPREIELAKNVPIQVGIDVAGAGDDETALCARVGGMIIRQQAWHDADPRGAVVKVLQELRTHPVYRLGVVVIDVAGIGHNFALHVADQGFQVYGFNAGHRPIDTQQFVNYKAEAYFQCRDHFKAGVVSGLDDEECEAQLSTIQYRENPRGLTEIESKEDARKRGVPSPDRAEAMIMAFMRVVPRTITSQVGDREYQISPI